jgi:signal transduction histidine kinase
VKIERRARRHDRVKGPILIPFTAVLLLMAGALLLTAYLYEEQARQHDLSNSVRAVERLFQLQIESQAAKLHATLCPVSRDAVIKAAFVGGDRHALLMKVAPLFERLRAQHRITHFYLTDAERRVVLRVHEPEMHGDVVARATARRAQETGKETQGIELGPLGTLTLRAVKPWHDGDQLIGYLELGEEIDHVAQEIHDALGVDLLVTVHREFLDPAEGTTSQGDPGEPVVVGRTLPDVPAAVVERLRAPGHAGVAAQESVSDGAALYTAVLPLADAAGREIGDIVVIRDVTSLQAGLRRSLLTIAVLSLLAGGIVFGLFYAVLDRVEKDYRRQREMETQFARLSSEHQRIVQLEKLSEVGRTIGEIAHQINNPLVGVVSMAQLAQREADDPARVRQLLAEIRQAGADCHAFLQRMLAFTRVSRSDRRPTEMRSLVRDTIALFQQSTDQHPSVAAELPDGPVTLYVDAVLLRHALFNLLTNAAQANPPGGSIAVRLQPAEGPDRSPGWSLAVIDQGPGVTEGARDKLFTPFFTTRPEGTGLGLAVVKHVAMLQEGEITADNLPGRGGAIIACWPPLTTSHPGAAA